MASQIQRDYSTLVVHRFCEGGAPRSKVAFLTQQAVEHDDRAPIAPLARGASDDLRGREDVRRRLLHRSRRRGRQRRGHGACRVQQRYDAGGMHRGAMSRRAV